MPHIERRAVYGHVTAALILKETVQLARVTEGHHIVLPRVVEFQVRVRVRRPTLHDIQPIGVCRHLPRLRRSGVQILRLDEHIQAVAAQQSARLANSRN